MKEFPVIIVYELNIYKQKNITRKRSIASYTFMYIYALVECIKHKTACMLLG